MAIIAKNASIKNRRETIENTLLSNLNIDSFLFALSRVDVNLDDKASMAQEFAETNLENIDALYDIALHDEDSIVEFKSIKKYFE